MKKSTVKAFTLVEMLIVIVIIGILISALMPRMQAAQGRARDVARKTALSQIQSAIVVSQGDKGEWPGVSTSSNGTGGFDVENGAAVSDIKAELTRAGLNSIPVDPLKNNEWDGLGTFDGTALGDYGYMVTTRNGSKRGGFVLMAKTEVEGGSNWVVCSSSGTGGTGGLSQGYITKGQDLKDVHPCDRVTYVESGDACVSNQTDCTATSLDQLRYILLY